MVSNGIIANTSNIENMNDQITGYFLDYQHMDRLEGMHCIMIFN